MAKKLYEEFKISAIAEKIREKTGGTDTYTTAEMPSGVDEVYEKGYADGYEEAYGATWKITTIPTTALSTLNVNFVSNGENFSSIRVTKGSGLVGITTIRYGGVIVYNGSTWANSEYQTIKIKGGTDASSGTFVTFLYNHGLPVYE